MTIDLSIFKDYDIRGIYPTQINGSVAQELGMGFIREFHPKTAAICRDMRLSGEEIRDGLVDVFTRSGVDVFDGGMVGTEIAYFIAANRAFDLTIMISASHNPKEYNGLKVVKKGPVAITSDSGLFAVRDHLNEPNLPEARMKGNVKPIDVFDEWKEKIYSLVDTRKLKPLSIIVDGGNGMGGVLAKRIFDGLPLKVTYLYLNPDGNFPNHTPNPLIEKNSEDLRKKIVEMHADMGFAFDGDADRVFLFDNTGRMVSGTITTALLAQIFLEKHPGSTILYNAICGRIVPEVIKKNGGKGYRVRVGHSYIKEYMRKYDAVFAGEHSGHYYYKDYYYCESGVLTVLLVLELLSSVNTSLSYLVDTLDVYPGSGEINFTVSDIPTVVKKIKEIHKDARKIDELDGVSIWYDDYWFNLRPSKTEPLLRMNLEADTKELMEEKREELVGKLERLGGKRKD